MLYLQKVFNEFPKNFFFAWKMSEGGYCESSTFKGSGILVLQWQCYKFSNIQKM